ncbi:MAG: peptide chain release factor N(5)-glutamine methyltransferase [Candidatus Obscuribacterales bacterium]|nr:peptide chain release factor N(5)-glutamine methyltransferase [Candidatus Obscuribacterales bacterium]
MPELTIKTAKRQLLSDLKQIGLSDGEALSEANWIINDITDLSQAEQLLEEDRLLSKVEAERMAQIVEKRRQRMPLQYCLGYTHFMNTKLTVAPGVFIPRSDTETVVINSITLLRDIATPVIAEIGVGSGAISISLLTELAQAQVTAIDLSPAAIELSKLNAMQNGVIDRLTLILGNWQDNLPSDLDAIVSNPPYIPRSKKDSLAPEVIDFEPELALFGDDADGLSFYRSFVKLAPLHLKTNGQIVLEFGDGQETALAQLFAESGWRLVQIHQDMNGLPRVLTATRPIKST